MVASERHEPASERPEPAFERPEPASERPEQPLRGLSQPLIDWNQSLIGLGQSLGTDGQTDLRTDRFPPVLYRTSSPPVPSGAAAQKGGAVAKWKSEMGGFRTLRKIENYILRGYECGGNEKL